MPSLNCCKHSCRSKSHSRTVLSSLPETIVLQSNLRSFISSSRLLEYTLFCLISTYGFSSCKHTYLCTENTVLRERERSPFRAESKAYPPSGWNSADRTQFMWPANVAKNFCPCTNHTCPECRRETDFITEFGEKHKLVQRVLLFIWNKPEKTFRTSSLEAP